MPSAKGMKQKGDKFERELAAYINDLYGRTEDNALAVRAPLSGGGAINTLAGGADLNGPPLLHVEAKRVEKLSFPAAMEQAETSLSKTGASEIPVVINRRNRQSTAKSYALVRLDALLYLHSFAMEALGYVRSFEADQARHQLVKSIHPTKEQDDE